MSRLPTPGSDDNNWGTILNDFLAVEHNADGTLKAGGSLSTKANDGSVVHISGSELVTGTKTFTVSPVVPIPTLVGQAANKSYVDSTVAAGAPDATTIAKGIIQLAGDLGGTATAPTVPGLAGKEPTITIGTNGQYYRGDKTFQTLDKTAVALANVDNTSDATKNSATATLTNKTLAQPIIKGTAVVSLTDGTTITANASLGNIFTVTLGGNRTIGNPTSPTDGQKIIYQLKQDGVGTRTVTWDTAFRFGTDIPTPTLTATIAKTDYIGFVYNGTDSTWDCLAVTRGL